tara:strand:- start:1109 stop:1258 length:150 start_codon:yes stop_codon:yes gene_type:complete
MFLHRKEKEYEVLKLVERVCTIQALGTHDILGDERFQAHPQMDPRREER